ncbi:hypothetical protein AAC387_Pa02g4407 [Persea americana]
MWSQPMALILFHFADRWHVYCQFEQCLYSSCYKVPWRNCNVFCVLIDEALNALESLNHIMLNGKPMQIMWSQADQRQAHADHVVTSRSTASPCRSCGHKQINGKPMQIMWSQADQRQAHADHVVTSRSCGHNQIRMEKDRRCQSFC